MCICIFVIQLGLLTRREAKKNISIKIIEPAERTHGQRKQRKKHAKIIIFSISVAGAGAVAVVAYFFQRSFVLQSTDQRPICAY